MPATKIRIKGCGVNVCKIASGETGRCLVITVLVMSDKISQEAEPGESNSDCRELSMRGSNTAARSEEVKKTRREGGRGKAPEIIIHC